MSHGLQDMDYQAAVRCLEEIPRFTDKNDLGNTAELLRRLGHPERRLRVIHVAGTNGKGSVCAFLESVFRLQGWRTGLFTSPHLVRVNERFQICREQITDDAFTALFCEVMQAAESMTKDGYAHPAYFELLFALGMLYFERQQADIVLCETGVGGRLDATSTIPHPVLTVITSISLDHMKYLGDTIPQIAAEKAGIIRPGVPLVYDASDREAAEVIRARAMELGAPAVSWEPQMTRITQRTERSMRISLSSRYISCEDVSVPFAADYQAENASVAMIAAAVLASGESIPGTAGWPDTQVITDGIAGAKWEGRMEEMVRDVYLDGAHNEDGIRQLARTVAGTARKRPVSLLFSVLEGKDRKKMIRILCSGIPYTSVVTVSVGGSRGTDAEELAEEFRSCTQAPVYAAGSLESAWRMARALQGDGVLYCAGSLYLVGALKEMKGEEDAEL